MDKTELFTYRAVTCFAKQVAENLGRRGYNVTTKVSECSFSGPSVEEAKTHSWEQAKNREDVEDIIEFGSLHRRHQGYAVSWTVAKPESRMFLTAEVTKINFSDGFRKYPALYKVEDMDIWEDSSGEIEAFYGSITDLKFHIGNEIFVVHQRMNEILMEAFEAGTIDKIEKPADHVEVFQNLLRELIQSYP